MPDAISDLIKLTEQIAHGHLRNELIFVPKMRDLLARIATEARPPWQTMDTRPVEVDCFLAAVEVHHVISGDHWDIHLVTLDDETGEINEDTGWNLEDYTWWAPRPAPPLPTEAVHGPMARAHDAITILETAVLQARSVFQEYVRLHRAKNPPDFEKAARNFAHADVMGEALVAASKALTQE